MDWSLLIPAFLHVLEVIPTVAKDVEHIFHELEGIEAAPAPHQAAMNAAIDSAKQQ